MMVGIKILLHLILRLRFLSIADNKLGFGLAFQPFYKSNNYSTVLCLGILLISISIILRLWFTVTVSSFWVSVWVQSVFLSG